MARKKETTSLISEGAKLGEPVPRAIVDINTASVGIQPQPEFNAQEELSFLRNQLENIKQQLADATGTVKGGARRAVKQTQATVKLHRGNVMQKMHVLTLPELVRHYDLLELNEPFGHTKD